VDERVDGVVVVGGGPAGLALAAALRSRRFPVEVLTAGAAGLANGGGAADSSLCLWGGALAALDRIGLGEAMRARGAPIQRLRLWSATGRSLLDLAARDVPGLDGLALRSSALREVLRAACADVPIETGRRVIGYAEDDQGVEIDLETGGPVRAALLAGADGAHSAVRRQGLDDGLPAYSGDSVLEGIGPPRRWLPPGTLHVFWGRYGVRAAAVGLEPQLDGGAGASGWWVNAETGPVAQVGGLREPESLKRDLAALLAEMPGPLPELVDATPEQAVRVADLLTRRRPAVSCGGLVALIGDAAHPLPATMRLGASLAVEDAVELAEALLAETRPAAALRRFEQARAPRVAWVADVLRRLRTFEARYSAPAAWVRDAATHRLPRSRVTRILSGLLSRPPSGLTSGGVAVGRPSDRATGRPSDRAIPDISRTHATSS
jgi:2-polyprenyl-6-methoxyphenol hydroxylase-like FAD-dependent oxidoreductase